MGKALGKKKIFVAFHYTLYLGDTPRSQSNDLPN